MTTTPTNILPVGAPISGTDVFGFKVTGTVAGRDYFFDRLNGYLVRATDGRTYWDTQISVDRVD